MRSKKALWRIIGAGATTIVLCAVAACGSEGDGGGDDRTAAPPTLPAGPPARGEPVLPIDAYAVSTADEGKLGRARTLLVGQCLRRFGFPFDAAGRAARDDQATQNRIKDFGVYGNKRRYGVATMEAAERYGYHLDSVVDGTALPAPVKGARDAHGFGELTPAMSVVLRGKTADGKRPPAVDGQEVPEGGCMGEATAKLAAAGGPASFNESELVSKIAADSFNRSLTDPEVTKAFSDWSACMKGKGYHYATPRDAGREFDIKKRAVPPQETAVAKADVSCKQETNLIGTWSSFETRYQQKEIDRNVEELQAIKTRHEARMRQVAAVIANG